MKAAYTTTPKLTKAEAKYVKEVFGYTTNLNFLPLAQAKVFFENAEEGYALDKAIAKKILITIGIGKQALDN